MFIKFITLVILELNSIVLCDQRSVLFTIPDKCDPTHQYFDINQLNCGTCNRNLSLVPATDGFSCKCDGASVVNGIENVLSSLDCKRCKPTEIVSSEFNACVPRKCITSKNGRISCLVCSSNQITVTQNPDGTPLNEAKCITCSNGYKPSSDHRTCIKCDLNNGTHYLCRCHDKTHVLIDDVCLPKDIVRERKDYIPKFMEHFWLLDDTLTMIKLEYLCNMSWSNACQELGNICAYTLYDTQIKGPCLLWNNPIQSKDIPGLILTDSELYSVFNKKTIDADFNQKKDSANNVIRITSVRYTKGGKIIFTNDTSMWSGICSKNNALFMDEFEYGVNFRHSCIVGANELISMNREEVFSLHLIYSNTTYDYIHNIPVAIKLKGHDYIKTSDKSSIKLFSRYSLLMKSKISKKVEQLSSGSILALFLRKFTLKIRIEKPNIDGNNRLYTPIAMLEYDIIKSEHLVQHKQYRITFEITNEMDANTFKKGMEISVGVLCPIALLYGCVRGWSHCKRNRTVSSMILPLVYTVLYAGFYTGNVLFLVAYFASLYNMLMYNCQSVVHYLPPTSKDSFLVDTFVICSFTFKLLEILWLNYRQLSYDVFISDWTSHNTNTMTRYDEVYWRKLAVMKAWLHLQSERVISQPLHIIVTISLIEYISYKPTESVYILSYCGTVMLFVYVVIYTLTWLSRRLSQGGLDRRFMKLCSEAGISMFIFEDNYYGHYIHGRNDSALEENGVHRNIGLLPGLPHTSFYVCAGLNFRLLLNKLHSACLRRVNKSYIGNKLQTLSMVTLIHKPDKMEDFDEGTSGVEQAYLVLNKYLTSFIDQALDSINYRVRERTYIERLFNIELGTYDNYTGQTVMLNNADPGSMTADQVTWYGNEYTLASFDLVLFCFVICLTEDHMLAGFIVICVWKILKVFRDLIGTRNVLRQLGLDDKNIV